MTRTSFCLLCGAVLCVVLAACLEPPPQTWKSWIKDFGHDSFQYPGWVVEQMQRCACHLVNRDIVRCFESGSRVSYRASAATNQSLTYCVAKAWLLDHMPEFDKNFLPPSVSVLYHSMLDDNIAFALMADRAAPWSATLPLATKLSYILPYATFHEARTNWRPLLFAKFFQIVAEAPTTLSALQLLASPAWPSTNSVLNWSASVWDAYPLAQRPPFFAQWASSTNPPVLGPLEFVAYGYGSCSAWSTLLVYAARACGIPARQAGTPCWNSAPFAGLARDNPNVTSCWRGGNGVVTGGLFLNNHNWIEFWDNVANTWAFMNVPPQDLDPNTGLCSWSAATGCDYSDKTGCAEVVGGPGAAMMDHPVIAMTWNHPDEDSPLDGGPIVDARHLRLSSGEDVSPLVWSPALTSPLGVPLRGVGLRFVNRTDTYRCREPSDPKIKSRVRPDRV
eukprot:gnl/Spiro4/24526_TR12160_c0_g1_i1.p1 gnl/Spiro4/24526_TR12160_c0_g1~~gnl/Spiro4/24526_TR12160_c0_g1_i1.p1  ORF type:complete len:448 (+),score=35.16 gnl/Spiro4/24526_TR12160_c0_g1_i1:40-1383(+)